MTNYHTIIPIQPVGLGDIIFCITLVKRIAGDTPVIWPVLPHFVEGLNRAYGHKGITFTDSSKYNQQIFDIKEHVVLMHEGVETLFLPLRWTLQMMNKPWIDCMRSKYDFYGMDFNEWKEHAMWRRENDRELILYARLHNEYNTCGHTLVNKYFGSSAQFMANIPVQPNQWDMKELGGFSLFDWAFVLEQAKEIHTVSTSLLYILEMLDLKQPIHMYPRIPVEMDLSAVSYLFTKPYILH